MAIKSIFLIAAIFVAYVYATEPDCTGFKGENNKECEPWSFLRFIWSPMSFLFTKNPVALDAAKVDPKKTELLSPDCVNTDATSGATWYGFRRSYSEKKSVIALYDVQGSIAGIQARYPVSSVNPVAQFNHSAVGMYQQETAADGVTYFVLTAYFVDPSTICTKGRDKSELTTNNGAGDRLVFQNGKTPADLLKAPRRRVDALDPIDKYTENKCIPTMGLHSYYDMDSIEETKCREIVPVFLLHNEAEYLIGFGFYWIGKNTDTNSFESTPSAGLKIALGLMAPKCLTDSAENKEIGVTTTHVFFVKRNPFKWC